MSLRFAAARSAASSPVARILARQPLAQPANDDAAHTNDDQMLEAALRYFAQHGLGAARCARREAEEAFFANDMAAYARWLSICRTLDRRMAARLDQSMTAPKYEPVA